MGTCSASDPGLLADAMRFKRRPGVFKSFRLLQRLKSVRVCMISTQLFLLSDLFLAVPEKMVCGPRRLFASSSLKNNGRGQIDASQGQES